MMALHTGVYGGWTLRIVLLLGALSVPVLVYTGTVSFLRRKSRSAVSVAARAPLATTATVP
jgi:uncharacterized iron-regulated membrane protein